MYACDPNPNWGKYRTPESNYKLLGYRYLGIELHRILLPFTRAWVLARAPLPPSRLTMSKPILHRVKITFNVSREAGNRGGSAGTVGVGWGGGGGA